MLWEYLVEDMRPSDSNEALQRRLNELGEQEWELVGFEPRLAVEVRAVSNVRYVFKRPKR